MADVTFGQRLRQARANAGLSQSELERLSGVPKTTLSRYENDRILPSIHTLHALAHSLGVSEGSLLSEGTKARERLLSLLEERGVRVTTVRQAERIADMVADAVAWEQITGT